MSASSARPERGAWRPARADDLAAIIAISGEIHRAYPEDDAAFASRLATFAAGCFIFEAGGRALGYALTHPWQGPPPPLNTVFAGRPPGDHLHIHDVALLPAARGQGAASRLLPLLDSLCRREQLPRQRLIAVYGADALWRRFGFVEAPGVPHPSYGSPAVMMERLLP